MARTFWFATIALALAAPALACKSKPGPTPDADAGDAAPAPTSTSPIQSLRKLAGAEARVLDVMFSEDGSQIFTLEERPPKDEASRQPPTNAVVRRSIAGGPAVELLVTQDEILAMAVLGGDAIVIQRPALPKQDDDEDGDDYYEKLGDAFAKTALYRLPAAAGAPVRISPEGYRCSTVAQAVSRRWIAYSIGKVDSKDGRAALRSYEAADEETHVLGAMGEDVKLTPKGIVHDISSDGARVLLRRPAEPKKDDVRDWWNQSDARHLALVNVKDQSITDLPASISVDGAKIETGKLFTAFVGDGLLFRTGEGAIYRAGLDGSGAKRLAGEPPPPDPDAGAPDDAGPSDDSVAPAAPPPKTSRVLSPKGTLFELREEADSVVLAAAGSSEPLAELEGPLAAIGAFTFDSDETRVAFVSLADTSRDGRFDRFHDNAEVFVTDKAPGALSFGRAEITPLSSELRPKIAEAAMVPEPDVQFIAGWDDLYIIVVLPWLDGEGAKELIERVFVDARALVPIVTGKKMRLHLRAGPIDFQVEREEDSQGNAYATLYASGIGIVDPAATPLVLKNPVNMSSWMHSNRTLSGSLENTGKEPTPPIEAFARFRQMRSSPEGREEVREVKKALGVIEPGKAAKYSLILADVSYGSHPTVSFRAGDKKLVVRNEYATNHSMDWLGVSLEAYGAHNAWAKHGLRTSPFGGPPPSRVFLTPEQTKLPAAEREALMKKIAKVLDKHNDRFHRGDAVGVDFIDPAGGGWRLEVGKKIARYEKEEKAKAP
ncbi:hypothetical protein [Polyangium jinanense]|uniref:Lipoprotein n=1 Tax=Polyangium jinanense TaxID=2829994 RepID=A0A9X4ATQ5_9BACT|nr:hypothetical protein [Polyangium jinanense]MDC3960905.1 hypothetical protein [Polyangium jinanense]MDC3984488.1 hypothetical protein [Polyangium jinanense]